VPRYEDVLRRKAPANITSHRTASHRTAEHHKATKQCIHRRGSELQRYKAHIPESGETKTKRDSVVGGLKSITPGAVKGIDTGIGEVQSCALWEAHFASQQRVA